MSATGAKKRPITAGPLTPSTPVRADACLYLVLQSDQPFAPSMRFWLKGLKALQIGAASATEFARQDAVGRLGVSDPWVSTTHAVIEDVIARWVLRDLGSKNGTFVNGSLVKHAILKDGDVLQLGHTFFLYRENIALSEERPVYEQSDQLRPPSPFLATWSTSLSRQFSELAQIAASLTPVLIQGETGTGKEVVARSLHALSGRSGAFVPVNCGAIPTGLVESTFFGHRRGAFSGAIADSTGLIRAAEGGTLFLDEIGDLPLPAQASLLRVLQEKQVIPVGDTHGVNVDVRVCSASHHPLEQMVERGELRQDLHARLRGFVLQLPPLRERPEDLGLLVQALLQRFNSHAGDVTCFHWKAVRALLRYHWPSNIRELERAIETAIALAGKGPLRLEHLPEWVRSPSEPRTKVESASDSPAEPDAEEKSEEIRTRLISLLSAHQGNLSAVARAWGKERMQIHRWMRKFGLQARDYRRG